MLIKFVVPGQPFGKLNMQPVRIAGHSSLVQPKKNVSYMDHVINSINEEFRTNNEQYEIDKPIFSKDEPLYVSIHAYFKLQSVHYGKKGINQSGLDKLEGRVLPTMKPDCDNISKIICDAITQSGIVWFDDSQVVTLLVMKEYAEIPRVEVSIENRKFN